MNFYERLEQVKHKNIQIYNIIKNNLLNKNGKLEGQRINEKYFNSKGLDFSEFQKNNITNSNDLYDYFMGTSNACPFEGCQNTRRWTGLLRGYKDYCNSCQHTKRNWMSTLDENSNNKHTVPLSNIFEFVKDKRGNYSTTKIKMLSDDTVKNIKNATMFITWEASLAERLYCIENNLNSLNDLPKCIVCSEPVNRFYSSNSGYYKTHKGECARKNRLELLQDNKLERSTKIRIARSSSVFKRMAQIPEGATRLKDFCDETYYNTGTDYITLKCRNGHVYDIDNHYQGDFRCEFCFPSRSRTQTDIYEFILKQINCSDSVKQNDRVIIAPKELDIVVESAKLAIEYNSQTFHSSGRSTFPPLDKTVDYDYHLNKTIEAEKQDYQLFHIFSSEYLDETRRKIWQSMILNKLGKSKRIQARKCEIKEITNKEAKEFCEQNHIQGYVNSKIRIGLFHEDNLVQLITLSSPRQNKYKGEHNYELIRMCSLINHTVIGGSSRLIKYFERNYKPELLLSYGNRRWTSKNQNVYKTLGFEFIGETKPNYFYCRGQDSAELYSRIQFQKHKLKDFKQFCPNKTEEEIMLEEGYRKIYDSGNLIYVKNYKG